MKKKSVNRLCALLCMVIVGVSGLAGCGQAAQPSKPDSNTAGESPAAKEESQADKNQTADAGDKEERRVSAMVMQSRNYPGLGKMITKLKEEENITVDLQVVPDDQYDNLLKMKLGSGECPDMIDYLSLIHI